MTIHESSKATGEAPIVWVSSMHINLDLCTHDSLENICCYHTYCNCHLQRPFGGATVIQSGGASTASASIGAWWFHMFGTAECESRCCQTKAAILNSVTWGVSPVEHRLARLQA